ncbi:hypothetical protein [Spirosoma rhododendri]|uniref:Uncharacterized protein n=1 Tax=Spirosoma rhododendri TaxID=2728024 RepID=A0A7L5DTU5_9BACT|nr:hypothetical protein [Spirosoma rhododendri]QJD81042.1 hypothetical protein HH216_23410 [Spirosoma rhododendri]
MKNTTATSTPRLTLKKERIINLTATNSVQNGGKAFTLTTIIPPIF